jgi:hypothetical protein
MTFWRILSESLNSGSPQPWHELPEQVNGPAGSSSRCLTRRTRKCGLDNQLKYDGDAHAAGISPQKRCGFSLQKTRFCKDRPKVFVCDPAA